MSIIGSSQQLLQDHDRQTIASQSTSRKAWSPSLLPSVSIETSESVVRKKSRSLQRENTRSLKCNNNKTKRKFLKKNSSNCFILVNLDALRIKQEKLSKPKARNRSDLCCQSKPIFELLLLSFATSSPPVEDESKFCYFASNFLGSATHLWALPSPSLDWRFPHLAHPPPTRWSRCQILCSLGSPPPPSCPWSTSPAPCSTSPPAARTHHGGRKTGLSDHLAIWRWWAKMVKRVEGPRYPF